LTDRRWPGAAGPRSTRRRPSLIDPLPSLVTVRFRAARDAPFCV